MKKIQKLLDEFDSLDISVENLINSENLEKYVINFLKIIKDPYTLMKIADELRKEVCGDVVTFVVNRNINFTDICINHCKFCSFRNNRKFILNLDEIEKKVKEAIDFGCSEVCIQGGLIPNADLEYYSSIIKAVKKVSKKIHIHAFSPMEILHASKNSQCEVEDVLKELKKAGLNSMPGTAAEIFNENIRKKICPEKLSTMEWFEVVKTAHELKIPTTATMMYGHLEGWKERIEHILLIRKLQNETRGFTEFIPLTFLWKNNELGKMVKGCSGFEDLIVISVSRILLYGSIENIQSSWVKFGLKLSQAALFTGANDMGGTLMEEHISKAAGSISGEKLTVEEMVELIKRCGRKPAKRDTLYNILRYF